MNKIMKNLQRSIIIIFLLSASTLFAQGGGWILENSGTTKNLHSISCRDGVNIIAVGEGGIMLLSTNRGLYWRTLESPTKANLNGVVAISGTHFCVVGPKDTIYYTEDRGATWEPAFSNARGECATHLAVRELTSVDYDSISNTLYAVGNQGEAVFSKDSGKTWLENSALPTPLPDTLATNLTSVSVNEGVVLTVGRTVIIPGVVVSHYDFFYLSAVEDDWAEHTLERNNENLVGDILLHMNGCDNRGWTMVGSWVLPDNTQTGGTILHSGNKGQKWDSLRYGSIPILHSVHFGNEAFGYLCGDSGYIMGSTDGGNSWALQISPTKQNLRSVHFTNAFNGFICGDSGVILATQDGGYFLKVRQTSPVAMRIFPNPFSVQATINFDLPGNEYVKIRIYDILGNERAVVFDGNLGFGSHSLQLNSDGLASGIYICIMEVGGKITRSQIVVEK
jgi:photosystem II stability/assembly factor-like uncharacterized protein